VRKHQGGGWLVGGDTAVAGSRLGMPGFGSVVNVEEVTDGIEGMWNAAVAAAAAAQGAAQDAADKAHSVTQQMMDQSSLVGTRPAASDASPCKSPPRELSATLPYRSEWPGAKVFTPSSRGGAGKGGFIRTRDKERIGEADEVLLASKNAGEGGEEGVQRREGKGREQGEGGGGGRGKGRGGIQWIPARASVRDLDSDSCPALK